MQLRTLFLASILLICNSARAEAALADLIFLMPQLLLEGLYHELASPCVLGFLWGAAGFCWLMHAITGRDIVGSVMDRGNRGSGGTFSFTSHGAFTFWAVVCSLYVVIGSFFSSSTDTLKKKNAAAMQTAAAAPAKLSGPTPLPYPHGKSDANPRGDWPSSSGLLPGTTLSAYGGTAYLMLRNPGDDALWVRLCAADFAPQCVERRQVYLKPRGHYLLERLAEGRYHLAYAEITGANRTGTTAAFRVDSKQWDGIREMMVEDSAVPTASPQDSR